MNNVLAALIALGFAYTVLCVPGMVIAWLVGVPVVYGALLGVAMTPQMARPKAYDPNAALLSWLLLVLEGAKWAARAALVLIVWREVMAWK